MQFVSRARLGHGLLSVHQVIFPKGGSEDDSRLGSNLLESFKKRGAAEKSWAASTSA